eukprot:TRINITY_DN14256_c0_g2_i1.p1 TRINITY_DN14256_c0_g2~~TRINITY_DN14256_c0_g2_i1.p1  ORF type:complete len:882 (+),score=184.58 TRINITY_DN14256_c0_g2_i1:195-2840(+)
MCIRDRYQRRVRGRRSLPMDFAMVQMSLLLLPLVSATVQAAQPPSGVDIARSSNVVWSDPIWANDGSGAMPIGNGDVASSVWVDNTTGDLRLLLTKSDVFDEFGQPVKVGALRFEFDPPLWNASRPAAPAAAPDCTGDPSATFCQTLDIATSTVMIRTAEVSVWVWTALNAPLRADGGSRPVPDRRAGELHVNASGSFALRVTVEPYRVEGAKSPLGPGLCDPGVEHADVVVDASPGTSLEKAITWYHYNHINCTMFNSTMAGQGLDPAVYPHLPDPFCGRTWGAAVVEAPPRSSSLVSEDAGAALTSQGRTLSGVDLVVTLLTLPPAEGNDRIWLEEIVKFVRSNKLVASSADAACVNDAHGAPMDRSGSWQSRCATTWEEIMARSYVQLTPNNHMHNNNNHDRHHNHLASTTAAAQISDHANWDRYLALIQGRAAYSAIKFNGQDFTANLTGSGWDFRQWGSGYWWQNTRQPYYNAIAQGDQDTMRSFLDFYLRMLPYVVARTAAQFKGMDSSLGEGAALFEETSTQFGLYLPSGGLGWGCDSPVPRPDGASQNSYIRYHWTGGLELALMVLDQWEGFGSVLDLNKYLPIATAVVSAFRQRWPNLDSQTNKTDMWPSQALETYQCKDPRTRANCPTNSAPDLAGLHSVLPRLIALPASANLTKDQREQFQKQLDLLPALPTTNAANPKYSPTKISAYELSKTGPGRSNSENTAMYAVHPFRLYGTWKSNLSVAQQTYLERPSPCNAGWCQDVIQAAMLNLTDEAASQLAARAAAPPATGFRFPGFAQHYQDFEPSLDHFGFMRTALDYMLVSPVDDAERRLLVFPTFPTDRWNVRFKLHAALGTTIEASCQNGTLEYLNVDPPERRADVIVLNCDVPAQ